MLKRVVPLAVLPLLIAGCSTTLTNLTPRQYPREASGLYHFEVAWRSREHAILKDTIKPYVVIGPDVYPMKPTPVVRDRWEAEVPISTNEDYINYRYKFDYEYLSIPQHRANSKLSAPYQLQILTP
jgi:hypothetical protein